MAGNAVYIVIAKVDPWSKKWALPKALAEKTSSFFRLQGGKKGRARKHSNQFTIEVDPQSSGFIWSYLYTGDFSTSELNTDYTIAVFPEAKAWVLGEGVDDVEFQNCAMEKLLKVTESMNLATIDYVYKWTRYKPSCLRNYIIARVGFDLLRASELGRRDEDWDELMVNNDEFAREIFRWFRKPERERLPPADAAKDYHEHEDRERIVT